MNPVYKPGDLVRIKPDAFSIRMPSIHFAEGMKKYLGSVHPVSSIYLVREHDNWYTMDKLGYWVWSEEWLEPCEDVSINIEEDLIGGLIENET